MEGCPSEDLISLYMVLSSFTGLTVFGIVWMRMMWTNRKEHSKLKQWRQIVQMDDAFDELTSSLYGDHSHTFFCTRHGSDDSKIKKPDDDDEESLTR